MLCWLIASEACLFALCTCAGSDLGVWNYFDHGPHEPPATRCPELVVPRLWIHEILLICMLLYGQRKYNEVVASYILGNQPQAKRIEAI